MPNFDPTRQEMALHLIKMFRFDDVSDFDIEAAIYWFASDYHGGQASNLYYALSTSEYKPGILTTEYDEENGIVSYLYEELEAEFTSHD